MAFWSIEIKKGANPGDPPRFVPKLQDEGPQGLQAQAGDSISWDNSTGQEQQPWPTDDSFNPLPPDKVGPRGQPNTNYLSDKIPPGHSSRPSWIAFGNVGTVYKYCSLNDSRAHGIITITK